MSKMSKKHESTEMKSNSGKKKTYAKKKKNARAKKPNTLKRVVITGTVLAVFFGALALLTALNVIRFPVFSDGSFSLKVEREGDGGTGERESEVTKPDFLDPEEEISDEEIMEQVDEMLEPVDADAYFEEIGSVNEKVSALYSDDVTSESETLTLLEERGFTGFTVTTEYDMYGEYYFSTEIGDSSDRHPVYRMNYLDDSDRLWLIFIVNGAVYASLPEYSEKNPDVPPLYVTETPSLMGYDSYTNTFYDYIPDGDHATLFELDEITAEALGAFSY